MNTKNTVFFQLYIVFINILYINNFQTQIPKIQQKYKYFGQNDNVTLKSIQCSVDLIIVTMLLS